MERLLNLWNNPTAGQKLIPKTENQNDADAFSVAAVEQRKQISTSTSERIVPPKSVKGPAEFEKLYVHQVYDQVQTSTKNQPPWPKVRQFLLSIPRGSLVLDIGCGNGKYNKVSDGLFMCGIDVVPHLLQTAKERGKNVEGTLADQTVLPFRPNTFDAVLCIAVLHHVASHARRRKAINSLASVLKPGGKAMICVWALEQATRQFPAQDVLVPLVAHHAMKNKDNEAASEKQSKPKTNTTLPEICKHTTQEQRAIDGSIAIDADWCNPKLRAKGTRTAVINMLSDTWQSYWHGGTKGNKHQTVTVCTADQNNSVPQSSQGATDSNFLTTPRLAAGASATQNIVSGVYSMSPKIGHRLATFLKCDLNSDANLKNNKTIDLSGQNLVLAYANDIWLIGLDQAMTELQPGHFTGLGLPPGAKWPEEHQFEENFLINRNDCPDIKHANACNLDGTSTEGCSDKIFRYYHVFREGEIDDLIRASELKIVESYYDHANWCVVVTKELPI